MGIKMGSRIAINGFGRIGHNAFKIAFDRNDIEIVAINDLTDNKTLAHLLKHDSSYGEYDHDVTSDEHSITVDGKKIQTFAETDPAKLPWGDLNIDVVIESTGFFVDPAKARAHIDPAGAKRVIISAPAKGDGADTIVRQVGDLRQMVDEFSNFARMPKPVFQRANIHDVARAALFLHEVAHPGISFSIEPRNGPIWMVCDRRQLGQALTNIVKNAVEAIEARRIREGASEAGDRVDLAIRRDGEQLVIDITDTGIGLPEERERLEVARENAIDIVFPIVHGTGGEDGSLQGYLEILGVPYVGSGVAASAVGMDKGIMKVLFQAAGLPVCPYRVVLRTAASSASRLGSPSNSALEFTSGPSPV